MNGSRDVGIGVTSCCCEEAEEASERGVTDGDPLRLVGGLRGIGVYTIAGSGCK